MKDENNITSENIKTLIELISKFSKQILLFNICTNKKLRIDLCNASLIL